MACSLFGRIELASSKSRPVACEADLSSTNGCQISRRSSSMFPGGDAQSRQVPDKWDPAKAVQDAGPVYGARGWLSGGTHFPDCHKEQFRMDATSHLAVFFDNNDLRDLNVYISHQVNNYL